MILIVPLNDDFGDWATPKNSTAGHFFPTRPFLHQAMDDFPSLDEATADKDPLRLFTRWYDEAVAAGLSEANAMTLATANLDSVPSARIVLLRGYDARGFVFFTNYDSRKGAELNSNPRAALVLFWAPLQRQVRIEGTVEKVTTIESDEYFRQRPPGHRLGALVSPQSRPIEGRAFLEERMARLTETYADNDIPRPPNWGGYRVSPRAIEFWQGRLNRLHDRIRYRRGDDDIWIIDRLAP